MKHRILKYLTCFPKAAYSTVMHDGIEHAGYLAFLGMLSLFPFLVLLMALTGWLFPIVVPYFLSPDQVGTIEINREFIIGLMQHLPERVRTALEARVMEIVSGPPQGLLTVAILGAIWTSSSIVEGSRTVLNRAYRVGTPPAYAIRRLVSIVQLLLALSIITLMLIAYIFLPIVMNHALPYLEIDIAQEVHLDIGAASVSVTAVVLFIVVATLYYILPNIKQRFVATFPGAICVAGMWMLAAQAFSYYLSRFDQVNLLYGSLGGIIAALLFFYIMGVIFIFGAELNYYLERAQGHRIQQKEAVVELSFEEKQRQLDASLE